MRKLYLRILIALIGFVGLGMSAKGQVLDQIMVNIPYEFVIAGKTLPAGTYRVNRVSITNPKTRILSSFENRVSAIILSTVVANSHAIKAEVSFEQVGGGYVLSKFETADHVFTIPISRWEILEAATKSRSGNFVSGSSEGSN